MASPALSPRAGRVRQARGLVGSADPAVLPLTRGIRRNTHRHYDRWVVPLIKAHWPEVLDEPFGLKLRLATCDLYASAPYTVLFCAPNSPASFRIAATLMDRFPLGARALSYGGDGFMWLLSRMPAYQKIHRRIITIAAFIAAIDHAFDHCMTDLPEERGRKTKALIAGTLVADTPPLRLCAALREAMSDQLDEHEREPFAQALRTLNAWVDAEVKGLLGVADPEGYGHRLAGIEGTIDGLLVPVRRYVDDEARAWMVDVSLFIQMLDDWIDVEVDLAAGRRTLVATGQWTFPELETAWNKTITGLESLVIAGGLHKPQSMRIVRETYRFMLCEVVDGMGDGSAD